MKKVFKVKSADCREFRVLTENQNQVRRLVIAANNLDCIVEDIVNGVHSVKEFERLMKIQKRLIVWKDSPDDPIEVNFGIGDFDEELDDHVFYWVDSIEDLESLKDPEGVEEFYIIND